MALPTGSTVPRELLVQALGGNVRVAIQIENALDAVAMAFPFAINEAQETADQAIINAATADAKAVVADDKAEAAQADVDALEPIEYVVAVADPATPNARVLTGDTGLTVDVATPNVLQLLLDVIVALGYTPADLAGADFSGLVKLTGGVWLGVRTASADAPVNGYITVMDSAGVARKVATIA